MPNPPPKLDNEWLTMKEAAAYFRINVMTLYQWIQRGKVETVQIVPRGRRLIARKNIENLLERNQNNAS